MASIIDLQAQNRSVNGTGAVGRLRRSGSIPGVIYGRKRENANIQVDGKTFTRIIDHSASDNILVNLQIDGNAQLALVQEVQHDHLKGGILHVDFHAINMDEEIHADVPIELVGSAEGVKAGGQLDFLLHTITVYCLPKDLPEKITVDVTPLQMGEAFHVSQIVLPTGVKVRLDGDVVIAVVEEAKAEEAPAAAPAAAATPAKGAAPAAAAAKK
ncbi:MAG: 50S ribosomal protein L25 [Verrucomicrobiaceae bacterium]|nr:50S ribosomal protein L25 [Verrucomicrobiaceae bacterium]